MKSSNLRTDKYRKKITALIIPGQSQRYLAALPSRLQLEFFVKSLGITPMLQFSYIAFAEQLLKITKTHKRQIAVNEAVALATKWSLRGLTYSNINKIGIFLGFGTLVTGPLTRYEYYITGADSWVEMYGSSWRSQTFTVGTTGPNNDHQINNIRFLLKREGANPGTLTISIRVVDGAGKPTGPDLSIGTYNTNLITTDAAGEWITVNMSAYTLLASTKYAAVLRCQGDGTNKLWCRRDGSAPTYTGGNWLYSINSGNTWSAQMGVDGLFEIWGTAV